MIQTRFSLFILLPIIITVILSILIIIDLAHLLIKESLSINFFANSNLEDFTGKWLSFILLSLFFFLFMKEEIIKKILYIKVNRYEIEIKNIISLKKHSLSEITALEEIVLTTRFGLKNRVTVLKLGKKKYFISQLYTKNYNAIKNLLEEVIENNSL